MKKIVILLFAALPFLFVACEKDDNTLDTLRKLKMDKIYVAGYIQSGGVNTAVFWNNGTTHLLSDRKMNSMAQSIVVANRRVYVAGSAADQLQNTNAVLWVDGVKQTLSDGTTPAMACCVCVSGDDVYVVGVEFHNGTQRIPVLWVNGRRHKLASQSGQAMAMSVFVADPDIYVAGYEIHSDDSAAGADTSALLWKNGEPETLNANGQAAKANSVFVCGTDVYVAGTTYDQKADSQPALWKNGSLQRVKASAATSANAIYVFNGNTYLAGSTQSGSSWPAAKFWKNKEARRLPLLGTGEASEAFSVYVDDKSYYVAGYEGKVAKIWFDRICYVLQTNLLVYQGHPITIYQPITQSRAHSVYVAQ